MVDIIHRIAVKAPLSKVYTALSTAEGVAGWWTQETSGESKQGGTLHVRFTSHGEELGKMSFELARLAPQEGVVWRIKSGPDEWLGTSVTFDLLQEGEHTIVKFGHRNWREAVDFTAHCSMKWATFLLSLRDFIETGTGKPAPGDLKIDTWN